MILQLNSEIPFGKYTGQTPESLLSPSYDARRVGVSYLYWLFKNTNLKASDEVRSAMMEYETNHPRNETNNSLGGHNYDRNSDGNLLIGAYECGRDY